MAAVSAAMTGGDDGPIRKKPKISELPLSSVKRASIDSLLHVFKKKGEFDALRKKTYKQFEDGVSRASRTTRSCTDLWTGLETEAPRFFADLYRQ